jgi:hypothetical protein
MAQDPSGSGEEREGCGRSRRCTSGASPACFNSSHEPARTASNARNFWRSLDAAARSPSASADGRRGGVRTVPTVRSRAGDRAVRRAHDGGPSWTAERPSDGPPAGSGSSNGAARRSGEALVDGTQSTRSSHGASRWPARRMCLVCARLSSPQRDRGSRCPALPSLEDPV